jgi:hypothetical protein
LRPFQQRPTLDIASFGEEPRAYLLANGWLPADLEDVLSTMVETEDYFFFAINPDQQVTAFRSHVESSDLQTGDLYADAI